MQSKLSKLQKSILLWMVENTSYNENWSTPSYYAKQYRKMKYDIAKQLGKTEPSQRTYKVSGKERIKEAFHPTFRHAFLSLKKRGLVTEYGTSREAKEMIKKPPHDFGGYC